MQIGVEPGLILIVKAPGPARDLVELTLDTEGFRAVPMADGREALRFMESNRLPELILLDLSDPALDGLGTLNLLKLNPGLREVPVAIVTGEHQASDQTLAWMIGADFHLPEPLSVSLLTRIARRMCTRPLTREERELLIGV